MEEVRFISSTLDCSFTHVYRECYMQTDVLIIKGPFERHAWNTHKSCSDDYLKRIICRPLHVELASYVSGYML